MKNENEFDDLDQFTRKLRRMSLEMRTNIRTDEDFERFKEKYYIELAILDEFEKQGLIKFDDYDA